MIFIYEMSIIFSIYKRNILIHSVIFFKKIKSIDQHTEYKLQNSGLGLNQILYKINQSCPQLVMTTFFDGFPLPEPNVSIFLAMSYPSTTLPKTTCFPSSHGHGTVVMKNWDPLVFFPALAIDKSPGYVCLYLKFSSANFSP